MVPTNKHKAKRGNSFGFYFKKFTDFLKRNWFILIVFLLALPYAYRYYKAQMQTNAEQDVSIDKDKSWLANSSSTTQQQRADKITKSKDLQAVAKKLAVDLGTKFSDTNFSWLSPSSWGALNPRGWTENDSEVLTALLKYRNYYPALQRLYHDCYSNSRDLSNDVNDLLDPKELKRLKQAIKI